MDYEMNPCAVACGKQLQQEFRHLRSQWLWLMLFGILLVVCGSAALIFPLVTVWTTVLTMMILGITLMVAGVATIVASFWTGKWSGMMLQLLIGILYLVTGFVISGTPEDSALTLTLFIAAFFIVAGLFRAVAALVVQFPHWGWALLNGVVTFMLGVIIYRHFPESALWVLGILVGVEMLFNGWTWIMLSQAIRRIPADAT